MGRKGNVGSEKKSSEKGNVLDGQTKSQHLPPSKSTSDMTANMSYALDTAGSSKYVKRKMTTNWQKYDEDTSLAMNTPKGLDFSDFCEQKSCNATNSYFRFSSEKNWELEEKHDEYFKLNVNDLCGEILCIPLNERLKLEENLLSPEQMQNFQSEAMKYCSLTKESTVLTKNIEKTMLSLLKNEDEIKEESTTGVGWSQATDETLHKQSKTWDDNSENFFSLSGVEKELDLILSTPVAPNVLESKICLIN